MADPDWESDVSAEDGKISWSALLQMKQVMEGSLWEELQPFLDSQNVWSVRTSANKWNDASKYGPYRELVFPLVQKEPSENVGDFVSTPSEMHDFMRVVEQEYVLSAISVIMACSSQ